MTWEPSKFGNLTTLSFDAEQIWLPDIAVSVWFFVFVPLKKIVVKTTVGMNPSYIFNCIFKVLSSLVDTLPPKGQSATECFEFKKNQFINENWKVTPPHLHIHNYVFFSPSNKMTNSAEHLYTISRDIRFVVRVTSEGNFKFVPTGTARSWCDFKMMQFPFDFQTVIIQSSIFFN